MKDKIELKIIDFNTTKDDKDNKVNKDNKSSMNCENGVCKI